MTPLTRISGYAHVAERYGFEEAVFLESIVFWYRTNKAENRNFRDGRWWTHNSIKAFEEIFPWWSGKQIRRIANSCRDQGALIAGGFNQDRRDRTLWYTPGDELLELYNLSETGNCICPDGQMREPEEAGECAETGNCTCPDGQMQEPERAGECAQTGQPLPCSTHGETDMTPYSPPGQPEAAGTAVRQSRMTSPAGDGAPPDKPKAKPKCSRRDKSAPAHNPEAFEVFWSAYPRKDGRKKSIEAWDKLKPDRGLCRTMYGALKRQCCDPRWAEEGGKFIPYFSTWLNQRRWENAGVDLSLVSVPRSSDDCDWADYSRG